jgi:hypothetical protein
LKKSAFFLFGFLFFYTTKAQTSPDKKVINHQAQVWASVNSSFRFSEKWGVAADFHMRRSNAVTNPGTYLGRVGAMYWINDQTTLMAGYANLRSAQAEGHTTWTNEHRIYEQFQFATTLGKTVLTQRFRNEQRFKQTLDPTTDQVLAERTFSNRARYLMAFTIPLSQKNKRPSLVLAEEFMLQFGKDIIYNTFDQNRIFIGIKQPISPNWYFDFGYMQVFQQKSNGYVYDVGHTLRVFFYYTWAHSKAKTTTPITGEE